MAIRTLRAAIVGASTLLGRELAEQLNDAAAAWDLTLLDSEDATLLERDDDPVPDETDELEL